LEQLALFLALGATLSFGTASLFFRHFSKRASVLWVNTLKALVALTLLVPTLVVLRFWDLGPLSSSWSPPSVNSIQLLLTSGAIGLGVGDLFLLAAFLRLGVSRTLMLYGFQPLFLALAGFILFNQALDFKQFFALTTLIACVVVFSLEARSLKLKSPSDANGRGLGLVFGLIGVSMDSSGVILTRLALEQSQSMHSLEAHWILCLGA